MSKFEVIRGVEGCCLALDDTRIAGPKPWGGGTVIHAWETGKEYKAVDTRSRWFDLFGTPERAANTVLALQICPMSKDECEEFCPAHDVCFEFYKDGRTVYEMAEWLRGDAE